MSRPLPPPIVTTIGAKKENERFIDLDRTRVDANQNVESRDTRVHHPVSSGITNNNTSTLYKNMARDEKEVEKKIVMVTHNSINMSYGLSSSSFLTSFDSPSAVASSGRDSLYDILKTNDLPLHTNDTPAMLEVNDMKKKVAARNNVEKKIITKDHAQIEKVRVCDNSQEALTQSSFPISQKMSQSEEEIIEIYTESVLHELSIQTANSYRMTEAQHEKKQTEKKNRAGCEENGNRFNFPLRNNLHKPKMKSYEPIPTRHPTQGLSDFERERELPFDAIFSFSKEFEPVEDITSLFYEKTKNVCAPESSKTLVSSSNCSHTERKKLVKEIGVTATICNGESVVSDTEATFLTPPQQLTKGHRLTSFEPPKENPHPFFSRRFDDSSISYDIRSSRMGSEKLDLSDDNIANIESTGSKDTQTLPNTNTGKHKEENNTEPSPSEKRQKTFVFPNVNDALLSKKKKEKHFNLFSSKSNHWRNKSTHFCPRVSFIRLSSERDASSPLRDASLPLPLVLNSRTSPLSLELELEPIMPPISITNDIMSFKSQPRKESDDLLTSWYARDDTIAKQRKDTYKEKEEESTFQKKTHLDIPGSLARPLGSLDPLDTIAEDVSFLNPLESSSDIPNSVAVGTQSRSYSSFTSNLNRHMVAESCSLRGKKYESQRWGNNCSKRSPLVSTMVKKRKIADISNTLLFSTPHHRILHHSDKTIHNYNEKNETVVTEDIPLLTPLSRAREVLLSPPKVIRTNRVKVKIVETEHEMVSSAKIALSGSTSQESKLPKTELCRPELESSQDSATLEFLKRIPTSARNLQPIYAQERLRQERERLEREGERDPHVHQPLAKFAEDINKYSPREWNEIGLKSLGNNVDEVVMLGKKQIQPSFDSEKFYADVSPKLDKDFNVNSTSPTVDTSKRSRVTMKAASSSIVPSFHRSLLRKSNASIPLPFPRTFASFTKAIKDVGIMRQSGKEERFGKNTALMLQDIRSDGREQNGVSSGVNGSKSRLTGFFDENDLEEEDQENEN